MYQMVLCDPRATAKVDQAFLPQTLNNGHARGITYGKQLLDLPYSDLLKHLILECLYERPSLRPDLSILRSRAQIGFNAAGGETAVDTWDLFICPDPIEPPGLQKTATKAPPPPANGYLTAFLVAQRVAPLISNPQNIPLPSPESTFSSTELNQQSPANPDGGPNTVQPLYGVASVILSVANNFTPQPAPNLERVPKTAAQSSSSQLLTRQGHRQSQQASLSRNRTETSFGARLVRQERRQQLDPALPAGLLSRNLRGSSSKAMSNLNARIEALEVGTGNISNGSNISGQGRALPQTFEDASKGSNISALLHGMVPSNPIWQGGENAGVGIIARSDADTSTDSGSGRVVFDAAEKIPRSKRRRLDG
ncbi:hypothetical protein B0O99DRAFT_619807 [Bisporella sp. PMI_857]|nr:hypothetical protein B0O99DRAFT_619807 [Bisporella sp. PMI_857]